MAPSNLHKLSYWEEVYQGEKENYDESNIVPEEWFEENCDKIINWVNNHFKEEEKKNVSILDIGCGNGLFLHKLHQRGFKKLCGFDFSENAIELAKKFLSEGDNNRNISSCINNNSNHSNNHSNGYSINGSNRYNNDETHIQVLDIYNIEKEINDKSKLKKKYDLLNDKGTFDIFFMNNKPYEYFKHVSFFFQVNTLFCLTSCNACKEELLNIVKKFNETNTKFELSLYDEICYKTITFGGITGQIITTLIFLCS
ncbi:methyltransferase [Plasmodium gonderi]|uniref:Protein-lysine N-methyltransferase PGO_071450 n=1 Tax=Plasmodium gonderi TaxID=77519 RepID=A0A1Y1JDA9_PLAGO|nr:methyltransferase [Plasmodium gonderi]GAW80230.1 methyltransferase [Plasmodium gonderi]